MRKIRIAGRSGGVGVDSRVRDGHRRVAAVIIMFASRAPGFAPWSRRPATCRCTAIRSSACIRTIRRPSRRDCSTSTACCTKAPARTASRRSARSKLETGKVLQQRDVPAAAFRRRHHRLEERSDRADLADRTSRSSTTATTFQPKKQFTYPGEGWGLTQDGDEPDHERRHRRAALPRSGDVRRAAAHQGDRGRRAAAGTSTSSST